MVVYDATLKRIQSPKRQPEEPDRKVTWAKIWVYVAQGYGQKWIGRTLGIRVETMAQWRLRSPRYRNGLKRARKAWDKVAIRLACEGAGGPKGERNAGNRFKDMVADPSIVDGLA